MKSSDSKVAKAHHPDMEQPQTGQVTLFVLSGRLLTRGNSEKKTNAENVCTGQLAVQRIKHHEMVKSTNTHHGALSVRSRQADRVPGLMPLAKQILTLTIKLDHSTFSSGMQRGPTGRKSL